VQSEGFFHCAVDTSAGSLSPRTKFNDLANYEFLLPPQEEQAHLAELLWAADEVVEREKEVKKQLQIVEEFLIQNISLKHKKSNVVLDDIMEFKYGKSLKESERKTGRYSVVGSAGIIGLHDSFYVNGPGIVVGRKGSSGNVIWINNDFWPIDTVYWIKLKINDLDLCFIYLLLRSLGLEKLSITTAIPGLNRDDALNTKVFIPDKKEQKRIVKKFNDLNDSLCKQVNQISISQQLKSVLINQIF
jgi:type I restriction enzyme S subunit